LGVEVRDEIEGWSAIEAAFDDGGLDFGSRPFLEEGRSLQEGLREYLHTGNRPVDLDLKRLGLWNQFSRKERQKLERQVESDVHELSESGRPSSYLGFDHMNLEDGDAGLDYTNVLAPSVFEERINDYFDTEIPDDFGVLALTYLRDSLSGYDEMRDSTVTFLLSLVWCGYCARSMAIDLVPAASEDSPFTRSLTEYGVEQSGDPPFAEAVYQAGASAGLGERSSLDDLALRASWVGVPGLARPAGEEDMPVDAAVLPFEQLAFTGCVAIADLFEDNDGFAEIKSRLSDSAMKSTWMLGYFMRVQEQYSPVPRLWDGAEGWLNED
jgi:hypothetical protein